MKSTKTQTPISFNFDDSEVSKWELPEGAIARLGRGYIRTMAFSPDGQYFAVGTKIGLWLYDFSTLFPIALWETDRGYIDSVTFSPDAQWLAAYTYLQALRVWDIHNQVCVAEMELPKGPKGRIRLSSLKPIFSQDGEQLVAFNSPTRSVYIWYPRTGILRNEIEMKLSDTDIKSINAISSCFSPDLSLLAGTCYDHNNRTAEFIAVWQVETGEQITRLDWTERLGRHCFSPCGRFFAATGSEGRVHVWDVETGNLEETLITRKLKYIHIIHRKVN